LEELARYPVPFRKAIVGAVRPEVRVSLWREHLSSFLSSDIGLTAEQQALVRDAIEELPEIVGVVSQEGQASLRTLDERIRSLLTRGLAFQIFGSLGPAEPPEGLPIPADALRPLDSPR
jgi:hypothetical protein